MKTIRTTTMAFSQREVLAALAAAFPGEIALQAGAAKDFIIEVPDASTPSPVIVKVQHGA